MQLTFGAVVVIGLIVWALGRGDVKKGAKQFFILEWGLLAVVLLISAYAILSSFF